MSPGSHNSLNNSEYASLVLAVSTTRSDRTVTPRAVRCAATAARAAGNPKGAGS